MSLISAISFSRPEATFHFRTSKSEPKGIPSTSVEVASRYSSVGLYDELKPHFVCASKTSYVIGSSSGPLDIFCQPEFFNLSYTSSDTRRSISFASRMPAAAIGQLPKTTKEPFGNSNVLTFEIISSFVTS